MSQREILFGEQSFGAFSIGIIELARPAALNALNESMLAQIEVRLQEWASDPRIACVFIHSENAKAFCAGGDVKSLALAKLGRNEGEPSAAATAQSFFTQEYYTDYLMHVFPKPVVAWLDGICMGGGIGLTQGASHRVVTERTVMAMPEVMIGFFPDVGGSKFLRSLRGDVGMYLGLTGGRFLGATGASIGLVDHLLPSRLKRQVMADIARMPWSGNNVDDRQMLSEYLSGSGQLPKNEFSEEWPKLEKIFARGDFEEIVKAIDKPDQRRASLLSQAVFFRLAERNKGKAWPEVFAAEWSVALRFCEGEGNSGVGGEFAEGVRALLIDKDGPARWPSRTIADAWNEAENYLRPIERNLLRLRITE